MQIGTKLKARNTVCRDRERSQRRAVNRRPSEKGPKWGTPYVGFVGQTDEWGALVAPGRRRSLWKALRGGWGRGLWVKEEL